jgi:hypothetical protein
MLLPLGIEKGKEFKPDAATVAQLRSAAAEAHAWLFGKQITFITPWWPDSKWAVPSLPIGPQTDFKWEVANYFDVDSRGIAFSGFFGPPAKLGTGSFYLGAYFDSRGQPLRGENTKRSGREEWNYHSRKTRKTLPRGGMIAQGALGRIVWVAERLE